MLFKQEQISKLIKLKEENRMNLEELAKLRHLIAQFETQVLRINQEKERCEVNLKEAILEIENLKSHNTQSDQNSEL